MPVSAARVPAASFSPSNSPAWCWGCSWAAVWLRPFTASTKIVDLVRRRSGRAILPSRSCRRPDRPQTETGHLPRASRRAGSDGRVCRGRARARPGHAPRLRRNEETYRVLADEFAMSNFQLQMDGHGVKCSTSWERGPAWPICDRWRPCSFRPTSSAPACPSAPHAKRLDANPPPPIGRGKGRQDRRQTHFPPGHLHLPGIFVILVGPPPSR